MPAEYGSKAGMVIGPLRTIPFAQFSQCTPPDRLPPATHHPPPTLPPLGLCPSLYLSRAVFSGLSLFPPACATALPTFLNLTSVKECFL